MTNTSEPLSDERLARIRAMLTNHERLREELDRPRVPIVTACHELLAEVERQRAEAILMRAQAEGAASLLLDVQQDCVQLRARETALVERIKALENWMAHAVGSPYVRLTRELFAEAVALLTVEESEA